MLIHEDNFIKIYNVNGYITIHYLQVAHTPIMEKYIDKQTKETRYKVMGTIKEDAWRVFAFDCPRTSFEGAVKVMAKQRLRKKRNDETKN